MVLYLQKTCFDSKYTYPPCSENAASSCARGSTPCHSISTLRLSRDGQFWQVAKIVREMMNICERWTQYLRMSENICERQWVYLETENICRRHKIFAMDGNCCKLRILWLQHNCLYIVFYNRDKIKQNNKQNQWQNMNHQLAAVLFPNICSCFNRVDISPEIFLACPTLALCAW